MSCNAARLKEVVPFPAARTAVAAFDLAALFANTQPQRICGEQKMKTPTVRKATARTGFSKRAAGMALALGMLAPQAQADEAQAREILKAMTDYLEGLPSLSFDVDSSVEIVTTAGQKLTIGSSGSVAVQRPNQIRVLRKGGFATVEMVFDGQTLSVVNREANAFGQADIPGTIDNLVDTLRNDFQRPLPAADLLGSDVSTVLLAEVTEVTDLGSGVIRGVECDHLAFRTEEVDWQIWVAQGNVPHPCRFVITTKTIEGWPEYTLEFSAWGSGGAEAAFDFEAPAGATKAEIKDIPDLDEVAGIFVIQEGN
jgi:hypothetical protein